MCLFVVKNIIAIPLFCNLFSEFKVKQAPYFMLNIMVKVATELFCPLYWSSFIEYNDFTFFGVSTLQAYDNAVV